MITTGFKLAIFMTDKSETFPTNIDFVNCTLI